MPYPYDWTPAQQAVVDRIMSGREDFTFGPGSPDATKEDMGTYVGGPHSPAGGFAVHGGVALAPKEYNLFTPQQRRDLGIMDIGPDKNAGKVERYYASSDSAPSRSALLAPSPATGGTYATGTSGMGMYDPSFNYGGAPSQTAQNIAGIGSALGGILQSLGKSQSQGTGTNPQSLMGPVRPLAWYAPAQFPQLPYT